MSDGYGTWSVPGGWLELETPEEAAERETLEETGVTVKAVERAGYVTALKPETGIHIVTLMVRCAWQGGEPREVEPSKCARPRWVPLIELHRYPLFAPLVDWMAR